LTTRRRPQIKRGAGRARWGNSAVHSWHQIINCVGRTSGKANVVFIRQHLISRRGSSSKIFWMTDSLVFSSASAS
jgi:hypothetical protein